MVGKLKLIVPVILLLVIPLSVYALSSTYLPKAQKFIDGNCFKPSISNQTALLCYLFERDKEQETTISSHTNRLNSLEASNSANKALVVTDKNGTELGIFVDEDYGNHDFQIYLTSVDREISINHYTGQSGAANKINTFYDGDNCLGNVYIAFNESPHRADFIIDSQNGHFYKTTSYDKQTTLIKTQLRSGACSSVNSLADVLPLNEVSLPFTFPVTLPLLIQYQ